jgi:hypothetical protein
VTVVNAKDTLDPADNATDRAADDRTDRPGPAIALIEAVRGAAGNALRLGRGGREDCKNRTDDRDANFHEVPLCLMIGPGVCPPIVAIRRLAPPIRSSCITRGKPAQELQIDRLHWKTRDSSAVFEFEIPDEDSRQQGRNFKFTARGAHETQSSRDTNDTDCRLPRHSGDTQRSYDVAME